MSHVIADLLKEAVTLKLSLLDSEILLAHVLKVPRSYLYAWPDKQVDELQVKLFYQLVQRSNIGEPIPYLIGHQEFWSLNFNVTSDTLIPRPDTELLIELILNKLNLINDANIADLGTGCGTIALALAHERPHWLIHATDVSPAALEVAKNNAKKFKLSNVFFYQGSWLEPVPKKLYDVIVSNPPYIADNDPHLLDLKHEPLSALSSGNDGLDDVRKIISGSLNYLKSKAYLILEHGYDQAEEVRKLFTAFGYQNVTSYQDLGKNDRVTLAQNP